MDKHDLYPYDDRTARFVLSGVAANEPRLPDFKMELGRVTGLGDKTVDVARETLAEAMIKAFKAEREAGGIPRSRVKLGPFPGIEAYTFPSAPMPYTPVKALGAVGDGVTDDTAVIQEGRPQEWDHFVNWDAVADVVEDFEGADWGLVTEIVKAAGFNTGASTAPQLQETVAGLEAELEAKDQEIENLKRVIAAHDGKPIANNLTITSPMDRYKL